MVSNGRSSSPRANGVLQIVYAYEIARWTCMSYSFALLSKPCLSASHSVFG